MVGQAGTGAPIANLARGRGVQHPQPELQVPALLHSAPGAELLVEGCAQPHSVPCLFLLNVAQGTFLHILDSLLKLCLLCLWQQKGSAGSQQGEPSIDNVRQ